MKYFFFLLVLVGYIYSSQDVFAQALPKGLSVEPVFQELSLTDTLSQGEFLVTLRNNTEQPLTLHSAVVDFGALDESGGVAFLGEATSLEKKYALASWMKPEKDVVFLDVGEIEHIKVIVENRESLSPGGHYGALLFRVGDENNLSSKDNAVAINQLISVLVFAKKEGGEVYNLQLKEQILTQNPFILPGELKLRFQNAGNVHVVPRGVVTITDPLGRMVIKGVINPESSLILPETLRTYGVTLKKLTQVFLPGKYQFAVAYRYDGREGFITEIETRWIVPWQSGAFLLVIVGVVWFRVKMKRGKGPLLEKK